MVRWNSPVAPGIILSGSALRFIGIFVLGFWLVLKKKAIMEPAIMIYFISIAMFLIFELVSIIGVEFYARKKRNHGQSHEKES